MLFLLLSKYALARGSAYLALPLAPVSFCIFLSRASNPFGTRFTLAPSKNLFNCCSDILPSANFFHSSKTSIASVSCSSTASATFKFLNAKPALFILRITPRWSADIKESKPTKESTFPLACAFLTSFKSHALTSKASLFIILTLPAKSDLILVTSARP